MFSGILALLSCKAERIFPPGLVPSVSFNCCRAAFVLSLKSAQSINDVEFTRSFSEASHYTIACDLDPKGGDDARFPMPWVCEEQLCFHLCALLARRKHQP